MQNLIATWSSLDMRRRIIIIAATLAVFGAVLGLSRMAGQPEMGLLYAGLEPGAAGEVITALDQRGVAYEVQGDSILVDVTQRDTFGWHWPERACPQRAVAATSCLIRCPVSVRPRRCSTRLTGGPREGELAPHLAGHARGQGRPGPYRQRAVPCLPAGKLRRPLRSR